MKIRNKISKMIDKVIQFLYSDWNREYKWEKGT